MRRKAGWPLQQPAGIELAKPLSAPLRLVCPQPELALGVGSRLAGSLPAVASEAAAPRPEWAWLQGRVGVARRFAKAIAPKGRPARALQARWGAGPWRIAGAGAEAAERPSASRLAFRLQATSAEREAQPGPGAGISPQSRRSLRQARFPHE